MIGCPWCPLLSHSTPLLCVHAHRHTQHEQMNKHCARTHRQSMFLQTVGANIPVMHDYEWLWDSNLDSGVEVSGYFISGCSRVKLWRWWFWALSLFRCVLLTLLCSFIHSTRLAFLISKPQLTTKLWILHVSYWEKHLCLMSLPSLFRILHNMQWF